MSKGQKTQSINKWLSLQVVDMTALSFVPIRRFGDCKSVYPGSIPSCASKNLQLNQDVTPP